MLLTDLRKLAPCVRYAGRVRGIYIQKILSIGSRDVTKMVHGFSSDVPLIFGRSGANCPIVQLARRVRGMHLQSKPAIRGRDSAEKVIPTPSKVPLIFVRS